MCEGEGGSVCVCGDKVEVCVRGKVEVWAVGERKRVHKVQAVVITELGRSQIVAFSFFVQEISPPQPPPFC